MTLAKNHQSLLHTHTRTQARTRACAHTPRLSSGKITSSRSLKTDLKLVQKVKLNLEILKQDYKLTYI